MVLITSRLVVHVSESLQVFGEFRLGAMTDSQALFDFLELLLLAIDSCGLGVDKFEMLAQLLLFTVLVAVLDLVVKLGLDLGDAPIFHLGLEEQ